MHLGEEIFTQEQSRKLGEETFTQDQNRHLGEERLSRSSPFTTGNSLLILWRKSCMSWEKSIVMCSIRSQRTFTQEQSMNLDLRAVHLQRGVVYCDREQAEAFRRRNITQEKQIKIDLSQIIHDLPQCINKLLPGANRLLQDAYSAPEYMLLLSAATTNSLLQWTFPVHT